MCSPHVLWCNMYQDLLKLRRIMYLGITESKNTSTSQHILDGECHAHAHASGVARTQPRVQKAERSEAAFKSHAETNKK